MSDDTPQGSSTQGRTQQAQQQQQQQQTSLDDSLQPRDQPVLQHAGHILLPRVQPQQQQQSHPVSLPVHQPQLQQQPSQPLSPPAQQQQQQHSHLQQQHSQPLSSKQQQQQHPPLQQQHSQPLSPKQQQQHPHLQQQHSQPLSPKQQRQQKHQRQSSQDIGKHASWPDQIDGLLRIASGMGCSDTLSGNSTSNTDACGSGLKVLLSSLTDDIYVTTVGSLVATHSAAVASPGSCRAFRLPMVVPALLFTILLQMALVGLLWQAAVTGDAPVMRPEEGRLWTQLGHAYQKVCNVTDRAQILEAKVEELNSKLSNKWSPKVLGKKTQHSQCLQSMWDSSDNIDMVEPDSIPECLQMDSNTMDNSPECRTFLLRRRRTDLEFGWGMYARGSNYVADMNQAYHRVGYEYDPTSFIIMAFIALVIAVHDEIRRAVKLCTVAAALTGILPEFFGREKYWVPAEKKLPKLHGALVLVTPVLQLLVALAVLLTGGVLFLFEAATTDRISIITNSVALCFVLELDNKVGAIVRAQMLWHVTEAQPDKGSKIIEEYIDGVPAAGAAAAPAAAANAAGGATASAESMAEAQWEQEQRLKQQQQNDQLRKTVLLKQQQSLQRQRSLQQQQQQILQKQASLLLQQQPSLQQQASLLQKQASLLQQQSSLLQQPSTALTADSPDDDDDNQQQQQQSRPCFSYPQLLGLAYFAVVGLLVFTEALLLAPQCNLQALAVFSIMREYGYIPDAAFYGKPEEGGLMDKFFADTRINPSDWFSQNAWIHFAWGGLTQVKNYLSGPDNIHQLSQLHGVGMCAAYICIVGIMIFLLFRDLLPCSQTTHPVHLWWPSALMVSQMMVAIGAATQYDLSPVGSYVEELAEYIWYPAMDSHQNVLSFFLCCWGFVFVAWPLQFHYKWATTLRSKARNGAKSGYDWSAGKLAGWRQAGSGATAGGAAGADDDDVQANGQPGTAPDAAV